MITQLGKNALNHLKAFRNKVKDFSKVEKAIENLDAQNAGCGILAINANVKLKMILELTEVEFLECYEFI